MPTASYIGRYEFITGATDDHVFVDIIYRGHATGSTVYDAKLLYQYNTGTYQRKLIGFFEYSPTAGYYVTRTGSNPFSGVPRVVVFDPYLSSPTTTPTSS